MTNSSKQLLRAIAAADAASAAVATALAAVRGMNRPRHDLAVLLAGRRRRPTSAATLRRLAPRCTATRTKTS